MKNITAYILILLSACSSPQDQGIVDLKKITDSIPTLTLPFRKVGLELLDTATRKILFTDIILLLKYKSGDKSPFLYSINQSGHTIDSLALFEQTPYRGVDSGYNPWIEIRTDGAIIRTDTSISTSTLSTGKMKGKAYEITLKNDTTIRADTFFVNRQGKFMKDDSHSHNDSSNEE